MLHGSVLSSVSLALAAVAVVFLVDRRRQQQKHALLPPGPPGSPHGRYSPRLIQSWIEEYGPVISLKEGRDVLVIIGRHNEATQLLEKQGVNLSDRPHSVAGSDILGRGMRFMLISTSDRLRRFRKAAHAHLQPKATLAYDVDQTDFARNIIIDILNDPEPHTLHIKRFSASVTLRVIYGNTAPASLN
ncbi:hypothetical protein JVU11DRAFT_9592 [Chiua virens]|nr:hypothetical protein JVU11DRAFT_9592 [Chiua virens]